MNYYDVFNGTCPDDLPLDESPIGAGRVMDLVRKEVKGMKQPHRLGRMVRVALAAAAASLRVLWSICPITFSEWPARSF